VGHCAGWSRLVPSVLVVFNAVALVDKKQTHIKHEDTMMAPQRNDIETNLMGRYCLRILCVFCWAVFFLLLQALLEPVRRLRFPAIYLLPFGFLFSQSLVFGQISVVQLGQTF